MAKTVVVTGGKGGVGRTTVCANLSAQIAKKGQRVVLCDADFGLNNADLITGTENLVVYDIVDAIEGRCRAKQALIKHPSFPTLYVLTCAHSAPERYVSPQSLKIVLDTLSPTFDYVFIDCPSGIDESFHRAVAPAEQAIVVTTPHLFSVRDSDKVVTLLKSYSLSEISLVVNRVRGDLLVKDKCLSPSEISDILKIPLLGVVPESDEIGKSDLSDSTNAFKILSGNFLNGTKKIYDTTSKYRGLLGFFRRSVRDL